MIGIVQNTFVYFTPDSKRMVTSAFDGLIKVINLDDKIVEDTINTSAIRMLISPVLNINIFVV